jgi:class 3 adenylate cyclase
MRNLLVWLSVPVFGGALAAFVVAVRRRWFSRYRGGFLLSMLLGLGVAGVGSTLMVGVWGHAAASELLQKQIVTELETVGHIMDQQIDREAREALTQLDYLSRDIGPEFNKGSAALVERLHRAQDLDPRLLQLRLTDPHAVIKAERSTTGELDPMNRLAAAYSLDEGKPFVSDPFLAPAFKKYVLNMSVPVRSAKGDIIGSLGARYDIEDVLQELTRFARFNASGYAVVVSQDGHILAHPEAQRLHDDISQYPAVKAALGGGSGFLVGHNKGGSDRLFVYRPLKSPSTMESKPLALLSEIDEAQVDAVLGDLRTRFFIVVLVVAIISVLVARLLSAYIEEPLVELSRVAQKIESGDLTVESHTKGEDEVGQLARALNAMTRGLRERERIKQVFGQYVTNQVSEKILNGEVNLTGERRTATILFSDIRGFTAMSENMSPTEVVTFLNSYFTEMVEAVFLEEGFLDKFIGDGLMAVFNALGDSPDHAQRAVRAGLRMKALVGKINGERSVLGKPPIEIGIGIHTDDIVLGNVGSLKRLQYTAIGDGVNVSSRVEALNKEFGTTLLITETTYALVKDSFNCREMPAAALKGKANPLKFYEVVSAKSA